MGLDNAYEEFKKANKAFWIILNVSTIFLAGGLIYGTYYVLEDSVTDCGGIKLVLWCNIILHTANILVALINICGFETKIFNCNMVCGFSMFEMGIFTFMQVTYFEA